MLPRPYGQTILVKTEQRSTEKQVGSLLVIENATEAPLIGDVIDVGDGVDGIDVGSRVLFSRYAGIVVELDGVKYHVLSGKKDGGDVLLVWHRGLAMVVDGGVQPVELHA